MSGATNKRQFIVRPDAPGDAERVLAFMAKCGKRLRVTIEPYRTHRSAAQNRLAHLWIDVLRKHLLESKGAVWSHDDLWEAVKLKTLAPRVVPDLETGEVHLKYETSGLVTADFSEWLNNVEAYCLEHFELQLPHPDELYGEAHGFERRAA